MANDDDRRDSSHKDAEKVARQHGIKPEEAKKMIDRHGDDRSKLSEAVANERKKNRHETGI
jgi:hypothetical protein